MGRHISSSFRPPSPVKLFILLPTILFTMETAIMFLLPFLFERVDGILASFTDSFLLATMSAPLFWWLLIHPLKKSADVEIARANMVLSNLADAVVVFRPDGTIESFNSAAEMMFGYRRAELSGLNVLNILPSLDFPGDAGAPPAAPVRHHSEATGVHRNGRSFPTGISLSRLQMAGQPRSLAIVQDITERKRAEVTIRDQKELAENLVRSSVVPTFVLDAGHRVINWNGACEELTGIRGEDILGTRDQWRAFHRQSRPVLADLVISGGLEAAASLFPVVHRSRFIPDGLQAEGWYAHQDGSDRYIIFNAAPIRNSKGELVAVIETLEDITDQKRYEQQLEHQATHDALTGLPNRNLLIDRIDQALLLSRRNHQQTVVFFVDLDHFKNINDSLGHDTGDLLLGIVGKRLAQCVRSGDTVARQGGDEFVIVTTIDNDTVAARIAATILASLAEPISIDGNELMVSCSIGMSVSPRDGEDAATLLKNADIAMYRAKEMGRNGWQFFTAEMNTRTVERMKMEKHLRRALEKEELLVYFQPKVSLATGRIAGAEALIRWNNPELGMVSPGSFIPLAEETGLIERIGEWVLKTACAQNKAWQEADIPPIPIAVNLSVRQFRKRELSGTVVRILQETGLDPRFLELEITESVLMQNVETVHAILAEIKKIGITLSMDDFGTGYSSLSYLKRFPFDSIKIDQSFVRDIVSEPNSAIIARTIIAMAQSLHLKVVAEGVETEGELAYLHSIGCDQIQGYYFSRPLPAGEFELLLREDRRLPSPEEGDKIAKSVLIVDDEVHVASALRRVLEMDGLVVHAATSAGEGFDILARHDVAVVISDHLMPGMKGTEFLQRVKDLYPATVRMILTGHADITSVVDAVNKGAIFQFLTKPWNDEIILAKVHEAVRLHDQLGG